ncbi:MAG: rRNA pseudouridine synthase, partial [Firmicutes bacterium]|nr:rRNA pseudouridine synthase [Bacillota bacterium]
MRINKYIAQAGICSRRKADELIVNGNVKVNGAVMKEPGYDVQEGDKVSVNGTMIEDSEKLVYYLLNKPVGFITTVKDEQDRATVMDLVG